MFVAVIGLIDVIQVDMSFVLATFSLAPCLSPASHWSLVSLGLLFIVIRDSKKSAFIYLHKI